MATAAAQAVSAPPSAAAPNPGKRKRPTKGKGSKSKKKKFSRSDEPLRRRNNKPSAKFLKLLQKRARDYNSDDDEDEEERDGDRNHQQQKHQKRERPPRRLRDDDDGLDDDEAASSSGDEAAGAGGVTRFEEGCRASRVVFHKIMAKKLPDDPLGPILSAHKKLFASKLAEEAEEHKPKGEARKEKRAAAEKGHVLPKDHLDNHDKELMKIATQGGDDQQKSRNKGRKGQYQTQKQKLPLAMTVVEPRTVEEKKKPKDNSTAVKKMKKKKRKSESEEVKREPESNSQEHLEMEMAGATSREEDHEAARRLAKRRKVEKGELGGENNSFDGESSLVGEKKADNMDVDVDAELNQEKGKKKKMEKGAIELEELGHRGLVIGEKNSGSVCESEDKTKSDKKKRKKENKKANKDAMKLAESDNVDMAQGDDRVVCESYEKCSVTLEEGKQIEISVGEGKKRKGKEKRKESGSVAQDVGQNTTAAADVNIAPKEERKGKDKNEASKKGKEKVAQRKNKDKRVSFTDAVEILGDGVDDERGEEDSGSQLVHGKRFTREEDEKLMEAMVNYAKVKQLGEEGLEVFRECVRLKNPEVKGCWHEIAKVLPHRPYVAVYKRARNLLYRSTARKWTEEEYDFIRRYVKENGKKWVKLAAELGKCDIHVKDTWRRTKLKSYRKGVWSQEEYQNLFDLVNLDLRVKAHQKVDHGHRNIRENISWEAISEKITTRSNKDCCLKWYQQLASPLVKQGVWADTDDYLLVEALRKVDAVCLEDVNWDNILDHRSGELCRQRWNQMVRMLGDHREKPFIEQVEVLSGRYSLEMLDYRK